MGHRRRGCDGPARRPDRGLLRGLRGRKRRLHCRRREQLVGAGAPPPPARAARTRARRRGRRTSSATTTGARTVLSTSLAIDLSAYARAVAGGVVVAVAADDHERWFRQRLASKRVRMGRRGRTSSGPVSGDVDLGWARKQLVLSPSYATSRPQVRFHLYGRRPCTPLSATTSMTSPSRRPPFPAEAATGGLVIGHVTDSSTSEGVSGALVTGALGNRPDEEPRSNRSTPPTATASSSCSRR